MASKSLVQGSVQKESLQRLQDIMMEGVDEVILTIFYWENCSRGIKFFV